MARIASLSALLLGAGLTAASLVSAATDVRVVGLFANAAVVNIDGQRHMLRVGKPPVNGVELIAADSQTATLRVDGQTRQFGLQREYTEGFAQSERQQVSIPRGEGGHFRVTGSINGQTVSFMVDTGATSVSMSSVQARRLGIDYALSGTPVRAATASSAVDGYQVTLARVKVGDIELSNVQALVLEGRFPLEVLLGMSWLSRVRMDEQDNLLLLERKY
ncbi:retropepsin-like aspartic protease family protein [Halopseudomonas aestusnigri]|jgi:aspartyl protease family protein|uniref:retropepsin-like aspartic protease family protein n=1 Tax=Halopseudomonas aestusnigri TaxID=857252 RepID=UPI000C575126|nr:TIGR02281 family clan AA aspartic protease [Pseudomonadales bacterium]MAY08039.1 TIGR02281 family clan AA aspartic protease [Pseudomonadales bacterium]HBT55757.1 TIGR02281 family clan AA aspartic protease [Pseudomonas sp.]HCP04043.1 TIGR02281 family clan AA aspartic protease [Pseudomonas sp.]|tara:strand:- start:5914 stop:6570 length:657 start_codon:yes stop_codon:yes gene_type:complete